MPWDTTNFRVTTPGTSSEVVYSPVLKITTDKGLLFHVDVTTGADSISIQFQQSLDNENWIDVGTAITADGSFNYQDSRFLYVRWTVENTTATPTTYVYADFTVTVFADNSLSVYSTPDNYYYGDKGILKILESGKAHMALVGDSISNDSANSFWSFGHGFFKWARPENWEAIWGSQGYAENNHGMLRVTSTGNVQSGGFIQPVPQAGATDFEDIDTYSTGLRGIWSTQWPGRPDIWCVPEFSQYSPRLHDLYEAASSTSGQYMGWSYYFDYLHNSDQITASNLINETPGYPGKTSGNVLWKWQDGTIASPGNGFCPYINKDGSKFIDVGTYYPSLILLQKMDGGEYNIPELTNPDPGNTHEPIKYANTPLLLDMAVDTSFASNEYKLIDPSVEGVATTGVHINRYDGADFEIPSDALDRSGTGIQGTKRDFRLWIRHPNNRSLGDTPFEGVFANITCGVRKRNVSGFYCGWVGYGGWKIGNHAYPPGDPRVPVIDNDNGNWPAYQAAFNDEGLTDWIRAFDANIFHIFLGANDQGTGNAWIDSSLIANYGSVNAGIAAYVQQYEDVIDRYERCAINAGIQYPKFIVVGTYENREGGGGTATQTRVNRARIAEGLKNLCIRRSNCVFLDLQGHLEQILDFSDVNTSNPLLAGNYLADVVHPAQTGMDLFMKFIWSRVVDAAGNN